MASLKLTRDDIRFLRENHIAPESEVDTGTPMNRLIISSKMARNIIDKYGELNFDTFRAYMLDNRG